WNRDHRRLWQSAVLPLAGLALWSAWSRRGRGVEEIQELSMVYGSGGLFFSLAKNAFLNFYHLAAAWGESVLPLTLARKPSLSAATGFLLLTAVARGMGAVYKEKKWRGALLYLAATFLMHLFWPYWYERY